MNYTHAFDSSNITTETPETEVIASRNDGTTWRNYYYLDEDGHFSEFYTLNGSEYYYISATGSEQISVAFEFRQYDDSDTIIEEKEVCTSDDPLTPCTEGDDGCVCTDSTEMQDVTTTTCLFDTPVSCTSGDTDCVCTFTSDDYGANVETCEITVCNPDYDAGCSCTSETSQQEVTIATCIEEHIPQPCSNGDADCTCVIE